MATNDPFASNSFGNGFGDTPSTKGTKLKVGKTKAPKMKIPKTTIRQPKAMKLPKPVRAKSGGLRGMATAFKVGARGMAKPMRFPAVRAKIMR